MITFADQQKGDSHAQFDAAVRIHKIKHSDQTVVNDIAGHRDRATGYSDDVFEHSTARINCIPGLRGGPTCSLSDLSPPNNIALCLQELPIRKTACFTHSTLNVMQQMQNSYISDMPRLLSYHSQAKCRWRLEYRYSWGLYQHKTFITLSISTRTAATVALRLNTLFQHRNRYLWNATL